MEVAADTDFAKLAGLLEGFSVCRDAAMSGLRRATAGKLPAEIRRACMQ